MVPQCCPCRIYTAFQACLTAKNESSSAVHSDSPKELPFWQGDPALFFYQVEAKFATEGILQQLTKYHYIVGSLAPETAREVRDVMVTIPATNPFDTLKEHPMSCTSLKESQRMQKLHSLEQLGDQKSFQLLRHMEQLAEKSCNHNPVLQDFFLAHLPISVQLILKSHPDKSIEQLASLADSLFAVTPEGPLPATLQCHITCHCFNIIASLCSELANLKC